MGSKSLQKIDKRLDNKTPLDNRVCMIGLRIKYKGFAFSLNLYQKLKQPSVLEY